MKLFTWQICNDEGHRCRQIRPTSEIASLLLPYFYALIWSMQAVMNCGPTATWLHEHLHRCCREELIVEDNQRWYIWARPSKKSNNVMKPSTSFEQDLSRGLWICWVCTWNAWWATINCYCIIHVVKQTILEITDVINKGPTPLI